MNTTRGTEWVVKALNHIFSGFDRKIQRRFSNLIGESPQLLQPFFLYFMSRIGINCDHAFSLADLCIMSLKI